MEPIRTALSAGWPEAEAVNLLDDSLGPDRARTVDLAPAVADRIVALARYALGVRADGVLFTCSAFGPAIDRAAQELPIPVLKPNEAMFEAAVARGTRIGMLATFAPAVATMEAEFAETVRQRGLEIELTTMVVPEARAALERGDGDTHDRLLAERAAELDGLDALMLAHFSTARAAQAVQQAVQMPVLSSPDAAVAALRRLVENR